MCLCGVGQEERPQYIALDLDEEVSVQLETLLPSIGTTCVHDIASSSGIDRSAVGSIETDVPPPRSSKRLSSVWGALDVAHLLTVRNISLSVIWFRC